MTTTPRSTVTLLPLLALVACSPGREPITGSFGEIAEPAEVTLKVGEHTIINGTFLKLTFDGVPHDSRCPVDVVCVTEGDFDIDLILANTGTAGPTSPPDQRVTLHGVRPATFEHIRFQVLALTPEPHSGQVIDPSSYVVKLRLSDPEP